MTNKDFRCITIFSCGWQSIRLKSSNGLGISTRHRKTLPKGDKLTRVIGAIATMN